MSHVTCEQPALKLAASYNPLSASERWNLVADGYAETTMLVFEQFADEAMLAVFRNKIEQAGHRNIALHCGDAQTLPYADATFNAAFSLFGLERQRSVTKAFPTGSTAEFWNNMVKGSAPIQMMKKGLGEAL